MTRSQIALTTLLFVSLKLKSQHLTGTWEDKLSEEYCKLVIVHINDSLYGYTYDTGMGYCKADFVGAYNSTLQQVKGKNTAFIERTFLHGKGVYQLSYSKHDNTEYLRGTIAPKSFSARIASLGIPIRVQYTRTKATIDTTKFLAAVLRYHDSIAAARTTIPAALLPVAVAAPANNNIGSASGSDLLQQKLTDSITAVKESRTSVIQQSIITKADTVKITLYDDGDIDGDIVTIFDNGRVIANTLALTKEPYQIVLLLPQNGSKHTIELMAENEGSIPPNTAYMLVVAGNKRVEVKASSDKLSNAAIVIQKQE